MNIKRQYFLFNKQLDFARGYSRNMIYQNGKLMISDVNQRSASFLSRILDSQEQQMVWNRMKLECRDVGGGSIQIHIYASDQQPYEFQKVIESDAIDEEKKLEILKPAYRKTVYGSQDVLLYDVTGRYLWIYLELRSHGAELPWIETIQIDFPKNNWIQYLPEVYQKNNGSRDFMERYLAIFQNMYEDTTTEIKAINRWFDPESATREFLIWIAGWISIEEVSIWDEQQLKYLINHAMRLYAIRGTRKYLEEMIKLYTGYQPYIVEHHQIGHAKKLKELYGDQPWIFTVLVNTGNLSSAKEYQTLVKIVQYVKPAYMDVKVIQLQQYIFLDRYSYVGINSRLGQYRPLLLDGLSALQFTTLGGKSEKY